MTYKYYLKDRKEKNDFLRRRKPTQLQRSFHFLYGYQNHQPFETSSFTDTL